MTTETTGAVWPTGASVGAVGLEGVWLWAVGSTVDVSVLEWVLRELWGAKGAAPLQPKLKTHKIKAAHAGGSVVRIGVAPSSNRLQKQGDCGHTCARTVPKELQFSFSSFDKLAKGAKFFNHMTEKDVAAGWAGAWLSVFGHALNTKPSEWSVFLTCFSIKNRRNVDSFDMKRTLLHFPHP